MEHIGYIYNILNKIDNKIYIGQTLQKIQTRFNQHITRDSKRKPNLPLYIAFKKDGITNFTFDVKETIKEKSKKKLLDK
jgi:group I intron endonuclease